MKICTGTPGCTPSGVRTVRAAKCRQSGAICITFRGSDSPLPWFVGKHVIRSIVLCLLLGYSLPPPDADVLYVRPLSSLGDAFWWPVTIVTQDFANATQGRDHQLEAMCWNMLRSTRKPLISLTFFWVAVCAFLYLLTGIRTGSEIINPSQLISTRIKNCQLQKVRVGFAKTHKTASRWNGSRSLQSMWQRHWLLFGVNPSQLSNELTGLFFPAPFKISSSNMVYHTI